MEFHLQQLVKHCRVCGKRLCKAKGRATIFDCVHFKEDLLSTFGVDVSSDDNQVSPTKFCNPCYAIMKRTAKASEKGMPYTHTIIPMIWTSHTPDCSVINQSIIIAQLKINYIIGMFTLQEPCSGWRPQ